jgi:hypothetical protein
MIKTFARCRRLSWIGVALLCSTGTASAQWWGTNAAPCANHNCAPATPFGYFPTRWHQWPGAVYPDMARPTPAGEEIPPSRVDVPPQNRELEIQTPSTQPPARSNETPESSEQLPAPAIQPAPGLQPLPLRPTEEPSEPSFREVPGGGGPSFQQSPFGPSGGSSSSPRSRVRGVASEGFAGAGEMRVPQAARPQGTERKDAATLTIANSGTARSYMTRISTPDQEPELFLPSLAARPLAAEPAGSRGQAGWSSNPLRGDSTGLSAPDRGAVPAVALDANRGNGDSDRTELGIAPTLGTRANPLR